jgi:hypothetical protein
MRIRVQYRSKETASCFSGKPRCALNSNVVAANFIGMATSVRPASTLRIVQRGLLIE